jgi:hypothetical protein
VRNGISVPPPPIYVRLGVISKFRGGVILAQKLEPRSSAKIPLLRSERRPRRSRGSTGLGFREGLTLYYRACCVCVRSSPADTPNINSGKPWSTFDMDELEELLERGRPIADIAD